MALIHLVRHGQASFGAADYDALSDLGREQARRTGRELAARARTPLLVSGTLRRQRETAALLGLAAAGPVIADVRWNEYDHQELLAGHAPEDAATTVDERVFQAYLDRALARWIEGDDGGWAAFAGGAVAALGELPDRLGAGRDAVVVTSGGVVAALVGTLLGASAAGVVALNRVLVNASVTTVLAGSGGLRLLSFNEHTHLGRSRSYR